MSQFSKYSSYFMVVLENQYPEAHATIFSELHEEFDKLEPDWRFALDSRNPMDKRIVVCAMFLATVKVLVRRNESFEKLRLLCLDVAHLYVTPKNTLHKRLKSLTGKFAGTSLFQFLVKNILAPRVNVKGHPDGFVVRILFDKGETLGLGYGVDILECGICKLFQKNKAAQYARILCEVDYITSNLAGLEIVRTGTIANGASKCDFRYKLKKANAS